jgi:hypothetical protein
MHMNIYVLFSKIEYFIIYVIFGRPVYVVHIFGVNRFGHRSGSDNIDL